MKVTKVLLFLGAMFAVFLSTTALYAQTLVEETGTVSDVRSYSSNQSAICITKTGTTTISCFVVPTATQNAMLAAALTAVSSSKPVKYGYYTNVPSVLNRIFVLSN